MSDKNKTLNLATEEDSDWIKVFDRKRSGTDEKTELEIHQELTKEKPKSPKKHLPGEHDQSSHGNWADGSAGGKESFDRFGTFTKNEQWFLDENADISWEGWLRLV